MKLVNLLSKNMLVLDLKSSSRDEVFDELIDVACEHYEELDKETVSKAIHEREGQQSTYLGNGLAMPHARIESLNEFILICGRSMEGITYGSVPDKVQFIVMILSCKTKINTLLQTMGAFATFFSNPDLIAKLAQAASKDDFLKVVDQSGIRIKQTLVAKDIMNENLITLRSDQTIKEVIDIFFTNNLSGAPVVDEKGIMQGLVTEKELISIGLPKYMAMMEDISFLSEFEPFEEFFKKEDEILVKDIYSKEFVFVHDQVSVIQLAFNFVNKSCRRIHVLDDDKKLIGIIMRKDLIRKVIHV